MGVSIDLHIYDYFDLIKEIKGLVDENGGIPEGRSLDEFVEKVLPEFGVRAGDKYVTLWNEYYEDYNAGSELFRAVEKYFGLDDVFLGSYRTSSGANADDVLSSVFGDRYDFDEDDDE